MDCEPDIWERKARKLIVTTLHTPVALSASPRFRGLLNLCRASEKWFPVVTEFK
jgi:hypothetical protein